MFYHDPAYLTLLLIVSFFLQLCSIVAGQEYKKLSDKQTANMIKEAATPANLRKKKIVEAVREMNLAEEPYAANFGITMNNKMAQFDGNIFIYIPSPEF